MTEKKTAVKTKQDNTNTNRSFIEEYQALCEKHGKRINVIPSFISRDDGTWSVVLKTGVSELPEPDGIGL